VIASISHCYMRMPVIHKYKARFGAIKGLFPPALRCTGIAIVSDSYRFTVIAIGAISIAVLRE